MKERRKGAGIGMILGKLFPRLDFEVLRDCRAK